MNKKFASKIAQNTVDKLLNKSTQLHDCATHTEISSTQHTITIPRPIRNDALNHAKESINCH